MTDILVRIESIFDKSIGKILKDEGNFSILSSTNLDDDKNEGGTNVLPHDVHIGDLERRMGVQIKGVAPAVESIEKILQSRLPDSILFKHFVQQDAIYYARVAKNIYRKKLGILDLGDDQSGILFNFEGQQGDYLLVQIKELTNEKDKLPVCSDILTLSGNFVILEIGSSFVRVSRKIKGLERKRLHDIGKELLPDGFGIIIRTSATNISKDDLKFEINQLIELWSTIIDELDELEKPKRMVTGEVQSEIIFAHSSKNEFDRIRSEIMETVPKYHHFKAYSMATGFALDFGQNFIDKISKQEMSDKLNSMILERDYSLNSHIKAEFHYPDGTHDEINLGDIMKNDEFFVTKKVISQSDVAVYSNLELNAGDIMEVIFTQGSWTLHYKFYSEVTEELIWQMVRIITPLDLIYRGRIRAFDMGLNIYYNVENDDVINTLTNHAELDMLGRKMITNELNDKLGEVYRFALEKLQNKEEYIIFK